MPGTVWVPVQGMQHHVFVTMQGGLREVTGESDGVHVQVRDDVEIPGRKQEMDVIAVKAVDYGRQGVVMQWVWLTGEHVYCYSALEQT